MSKGEIIEWFKNPVTDLFRERVVEQSNLLVATLFAPAAAGSVDNSQEAFLILKNKNLGLLEALEILQEMFDEVVLDTDTQEFE